MGIWDIYEFSSSYTFHLSPWRWSNSSKDDQNKMTWCPSAHCAVFDQWCPDGTKGPAGKAFISVDHRLSSSIIVYHRLSSSIYLLFNGEQPPSWICQNGILKTSWTDCFMGLKSYLGGHRFTMYKLQILPLSIKCRSKMCKTKTFQTISGTSTSTFPVSQASDSQLSVGFEVPRHGLRKAVNVSNSTSSYVYIYILCIYVSAYIYIYTYIYILYIYIYIIHIYIYIHCQCKWSE